MKKLDLAWSEFCTNYLNQPCLVDEFGRLAILKNGKVERYLGERKPPRFHKEFQYICRNNGLIWLVTGSFLFIKPEKDKWHKFNHPSKFHASDVCGYPFSLQGSMFGDGEAIFSYEYYENGNFFYKLIILKNNRIVDTGKVIQMTSFSIWSGNDGIYLAGMMPRGNDYGFPLLYRYSVENGDLVSLNCDLLKNTAFVEDRKRFSGMLANVVSRHGYDERRINAIQSLSPECFFPECWVGHAALQEGVLLVLAITREGWYDAEEDRYMVRGMNDGISLCILSKNHDIKYICSFLPVYFYSLVKRHDEIFIYLQEFREVTSLLGEIFCVCLDQTGAIKEKTNLNVIGVDGSKRVINFRVSEYPGEELFGAIELKEEGTLYVVSVDGINWRVIDRVETISLQIRA